MRRRNLAYAMAALSIVLLAGGCATSGKTFAEAHATFPAIAPGNGRLFIYRTAVIGMAVQPAVMVNDEKIGDAVPRGFYMVDRPAGEYRITTQTEVTRTLSLTLAPGQVRYVRLEIGMGFFVGHVWPELVEDGKGQDEIADCHLVSS